MYPQPDVEDGLLTLSRHHAASNAQRPGLLRDIEEAAQRGRSEQADPVNAHIPDFSFSGITRALKEF
jgi:hypothetical protein